MKGFQLLLGLSVFLFLGCQDKDDYTIEERILGYEGEARLNPFLAAERFLEERGFEARSSRVWTTGDTAGMIVLPVSYLASEGVGNRAEDWIYEGGRLVVTLAGGQARRNDFRNSYWSEKSDTWENYLGAVGLFEQIGIEVLDEGWEDVSGMELEEKGHLAIPYHIAQVEGLAEEVMEVEFEGDLGLRVEGGVDYEKNSRKSARVVSTKYGEGELIVLAHARSIRNPFLARRDHAAFLESLVRNERSRKVLFIFGETTSFSGLIWERGWPVVIAGIALLVFWLWSRIPRLGPILSDGKKVERPYEDALLSSARFLWRRGRIERILRPLIDRNRNDEGEDGSWNADPQNAEELIGTVKNLQKAENE